MPGTERAQAARELKARNAGRVFELTLGYPCNCKCSFCSVEHKKGVPAKTTAAALADISRARAEGFRTIGFGGGEPTVRPDLVRLAAFARSSGFGTIRVQTNGQRLSYPEFAAALTGAGVNYYKFSIHGHAAAVHDRLTRVRGSFGRALAGLRNVKALGARTGVDIVITRLNYRFLPQYVEKFALGEGVGGVGFIYPLFEGAMKDRARELGVSLTEALPYVLDAAALASGLALDRAVIFNVPYCLLGEEWRQLVPGARLNLKVSAPGAVQEDVFLGSLGSKVRAPACARCPMLEDCGGVWKDYAALYGLAEFGKKK